MGIEVGIDKISLSKKVRKGAKVNSLPEIKAWHEKMINGEPTTMLTIGDSTGNDGNEWVSLILDDLAALYPSHTILNKLWNDTKQCYDSYRTQGGNTRVSTGNEGDAYAILHGVTGEYIDIVHTSKQEFSEDIDIRLKIGMDDWTPASSTGLVSKFGDIDGNRTWRFYIDASGHLVFDWFPNGFYSSRIIATCTNPTGFVNGETKWIRVTLDVDNGAGGYTVKFWKGQDGYDGDYWSQIGSDIVGATTTSLFSNCTFKTIIGTGIGLSYFSGKVYECIILNGISGVAVASPNLDQAFPSTVTNFADSEGNVIRINNTNISISNGSPGLLMLNSSTAGKNISYTMDAVRFELQTPMHPDLIFINHSHNESTNVEYTADYQALIDSLLLKYPNAGVICTIQNPEKPAALYSAEHAIRCEQIRQLAISNEYMKIDVYNDFILYGDWETDLMADNVHPSTNGNIRWKNLVKSLFRRY